jgi:ATP synthase protein I
MGTIAPDPYSDDDEPEKFSPLTAAQAQELREKNPSLSPWWVVLIQVALGVALALVAWGVTRDRGVVESVAYGAATVAIPAALFARGLMGRFASLNPGSAVVGFFLWEMVKLVLTVAMLMVAPKFVAVLSWPALLVGLVLTMKVYWLAMAYRPKKRN